MSVSRGLTGESEPTIKEEDLASRPTLQFINLITKILTGDTKTIAQLAQGEKIPADVLAKMKLLGKTISDLDDKFRQYEKTHLPEADIKLKQIVEEKQQEANDLEKKLRLIPVEHRRKTSEIEEKIRIARDDKKDLRRESLVTEVTDINVHTKGKIDKDMLEAEKKKVEKKLKGVCCPCTDKAQEKIAQLEKDRDDLDYQIAEAVAAIQKEKEEIARQRDEKGEKVKELGSSIEMLRKDRSQHISTTIDQTYAQAEEEFARAAKYLQLAKDDFEEAKVNSLKNIGRMQIAALLLIVVQFERFKASFDALYTEKVKTLERAQGDERDRLDTYVKQLQGFNEKLQNQLQVITTSFKQFKSSEAAARTASAIYRAYQALDEVLKNKFEKNSFVDSVILDQIILPKSAATIQNDLPSIADNHSTLSSRHSTRNQRSKSEGEDKMALSEKGASSSSSYYVAKH